MDIDREPLIEFLDRHPDMCARLRDLNFHAELRERIESILNCWAFDLFSPQAVETAQRWVIMELNKMVLSGKIKSARTHYTPDGQIVAEIQRLKSAEIVRVNVRICGN